MDVRFMPLDEYIVRFAEDVAFEHEDWTNEQIVYLLTRQWMGRNA